MRRNLLLSLLAAVLAVPWPAAAQPATPKDPLGEFGAYVDPNRAAAMIRECEAQVRAVEAAIAAFQPRFAELTRVHQDFTSHVRALQSAQTAVAEAEERVAQASGAEADRLIAEVLEPRRERYRALAQDMPAQEMSYDAVGDAFDRAAAAFKASMATAGVSPREMAAPAAEIIRGQQERCKRLRAWAQLGAGLASRQPVAPPADRGWPGAAIEAWQGRWSCRITTNLGREVVSADLPVRTTAVYQNGVVRVSAAPGAGPLPPRPIFQLDVRPDRPAYGEFEDPDGVGEGGRPSAFVDAGQVTADGHLTLRRRYVQTPGKSEFMACTRVGGR